MTVRSAHILVVEPDARLAATYVAALMARGYRATSALTAQAAITAADEVAPDLVWLELQLTSHSGVEFLYEFRSYRDWSAVPVLVLSGVPPTEFAHSQDMLYRQLGVTGYHYKPRTSLLTMLHAVENALAARP